MKKRVEIKVYGRVQGVMFRNTVKALAMKLKVTGFACNMKDGSVNIIGEGEENSLVKMVKWCKRGPVFAKVTNFEVEYKEYRDEFNKFSVCTE